jgi:hypothetical protein
MKRVVFILLGLAVATTVAGLLVAFSRPIKWPANVGPAAWQRALGADAEEPIAEEVAA